MLRAIVIGPNPQVVKSLDDALAESGEFQVLQTQSSYPDLEAFELTLCIHNPEVLFLGVDSLSDALDLRQHAGKLLPSLAIIGFSPSPDQETLIGLMRVGIRDFVNTPDPKVLSKLADRVAKDLENQPTVSPSLGKVTAFLPAKPGAGATTTATSMSSFLAEHGGGKVLLADLDFGNGLAAFMLKLGERYSIADALDKASAMDEHLWLSLVTRVGRLDVLASPKRGLEVPIEPQQVQSLLTLARRLYGQVLVDLPGNLDYIELFTLSQALRIVMVCTPEVPVLHLARVKLTLLKKLRLIDRVSVVMNRWNESTGMSRRELEDVLGAPIFLALPNDYPSIRNAQARGTSVRPDSSLGRSIAELGEKIFHVRGGTDAEPSGWAYRMTSMFRRVTERASSAVTPSKLSPTVEASLRDTHEAELAALRSAVGESVADEAPAHAPAAVRREDEPEAADPSPKKTSDQITRTERSGSGPRTVRRGRRRSSARRPATTADPHPDSSL